MGDTTPGLAPGSGRLRVRSVSRWGVFGQTLALGPIFSAGFLSGTVAVFAGFSTPLSVLLAAAGTVGLAYALSLYGRQFSGPGAVYEYLAGGTHASVGIIGAGTYLLGLLFLGAGGGFVGLGYLANDLLAAELRLNLGWPVWALVSLAAAIGLNYAGVRAGLRAVLTTAALSLAPFLVVAAVIIARGGLGGNTLAVFGPSRSGWGGVFHGMLYALSLFIGFETVAALGEEAESPRRRIPAAMIIAVVSAAGFYLLVTYAGAIGFGEAAAGRAWYASGNPFGLLAARYLASPLAPVISLAIVIDLFSVCVAFTLAASRVLLTLARDGLLPRPLARTSGRFGTPVAGLAAIAAWALLVIGWAAAARYGDAPGVPAVLESVLILSGAGSYLITLVYLMLAAGGLWLLLAGMRPDTGSPEAAGWRWRRAGL